MRITDLGRSTAHGRTRVTARVVWEDRDEPAREVFIETGEGFGPDLAASPHAFLVGCLVPAIHLGERRVALDAEVCPTLLEGLHTAMGVLHTWYGERWRPIPLETRTARRPLAGAPGRRAAMFLSGGVDSLAALRLNRLRYPRGHPGAVADAFLLHGFDIGGVPARGPKYHVFERARAAMAPVARDAGVELIPAYTNIRHLCDDRDLWLEKFFGAVLAAVAHAFAPRVGLVYIASSYDLPNLVPCGSHPLLDPQYSSHDLAVRHRDVEVSRLEKLRIIAGWDTALQNLRVCLRNTPDLLNCGECEKCVRTMTGLVAIGALHRTRAFPRDDVTPELLDGARMEIRHREPYYLELVPALRARGRHDLADVIEERLSRAGLLPPARATPHCPGGGAGCASGS